MSTKEYESNIITYKDTYGGGYGHVYPEGHIIRFNLHILKHELGITGGKILDFGCGTGAHLEYFQKNGYIPYGCDISEIAIEKCKERIPQHAENFHATPYLPNLQELFGNNFDVIISNQVLYHFNDNDLQYLASQFHSMLKPGGVFFATYILPTNLYHKFVVSQEGDLSKIVLTGRERATYFLNFKTEDEVIDIFKIFHKLHTGFYTHTLSDVEGPSDHMIYIGTKQ